MRVSLERLRVHTRTKTRTLARRAWGSFARLTRRPIGDQASPPDPRAYAHANSFAFWASNSASVRTPWFLRSASLAIWSAALAPVAVACTY